MLLWLVVCACGDNIGLPRANDLVIVAHQDDDLLFMQPDVSDEVSQHRPVTVLYITAGDAGAGLVYADSRVLAVKWAYATMAGSNNWNCAWLDLAGHLAQRCRLDGLSLELIFLGYPDGGIPGTSPNSLRHLWEGAVTQADTVADQVATYTKDGLIETVATVIRDTQPSVIRTLEVSATHGGDHSDHMFAGAIALAAAARVRSEATFLSYRGYNTNDDPSNIPDEIYETSSRGLRAYEACQTGCAPCGQVCASENILGLYYGYLHHHYSVAMRTAPMAGLLQTDNQCVTVTGGDVTLGDCARGSQLELELDGSIRAGDRCLELAADGTLVAQACGHGPEGYFLLDEEGHLWSGVPAPTGGDRLANHTTCLVPDGGRVRAAVCGGDLERRWVLGRPPVLSLRSDLQLAARGRSVRLADVTGDGLADLCRIERGGLWCAPGDGAGRFFSSLRIDAPDAPLAVDPDSLVLGDLDGDGQPDACGRTSAGVRCATAASGYRAVAWSPAFARPAVPGPGTRVLAIVDGLVCGVTPMGVACAAQGADAVLRSAWPADATTLWPGDLDGDDLADWCTSTPAGPACGLAADRAVTSTGAPWGFAINAKVEGSAATDGVVADETRGAIADVSGDGKGDLCVVLGGAVECALSQGHAFGPRYAVLTLAPGVQAQALWLGDLDGDGKADPCVDDGTAILCAISP
ncbi:MAG TPA: FG-GAP-like repeat-containing protein [Kofleriaceae bacterium]